ncbi:hypothetical protein F4778DRAFT_768940 [Xylariomycetidae sp. FL2044]|nr:hypothetical protein F4778DRAFT_768940 [Xylariomycetidae sp. FL2044]
MASHRGRNVPAWRRGNNNSTGRGGGWGRGGHLPNRPRRTDDYEKELGQDQYYEWKRLARHGLRGVSSLDRGLQLWTAALRILDGDSRELQQRVAKDVVNDEFEGLQSIIITAEECTTNSNDLKVFGTVKSFFQFITHRALLECISVGPYVGTMYQVFGGTNGDRAVSLFSNLAKRMTDHTTPNGIPEANSIVEIASLATKALSELLVREPRTRLNEDLPALLKSMDNFVRLLRRSSGNSELDRSMNDIEAIRSIVSSAKNRLTGKEIPQGEPSQLGPIRSTFPMSIAMPGGRHDNDFADLVKIRILPTYEEIMSTRDEYLPSTDLEQPNYHQDPVLRHIDSAFRLLRHDIFSSVKDVLSDLSTQLSTGDKPKAPSDSAARVHLYSQATIQHVYIDPKRGLEAIASFMAPPQIRRKSKVEQRRWWQDSSRLEEGGLVCLLTAGTSQKSHVLFLEVVAKSLEDKKDKKNTSSLVSDDWLPSITVKIATRSRDDVSLLTQVHGERLQGTLVDFKGLIPATFTPILRNLQMMSRDGHLSFKQWILPSAGETDPRDIPLPMYARGPRFAFRLGPVASSGSPTIALSPGAGNWASDLETLQRYTTLDRGQCHGLLAALKREYALIQGPPGTGKSYVGVQLVRILLENKVEANLGPILIICYTNHALDQFLKHLLAVGIDRVIRIGGRSTAAELDGKNLKVVSFTTPKTRFERQILGQSYSALELHLDDAGRSLSPLHQLRQGPSWKVLNQYLRRQHPNIHAQLDPNHEDGFTDVVEDPLRVWLGRRSGKTPSRNLRQDEEENLTRQAEQSTESLTIDERWALVTSWIRDMRNEYTERLFESIDEAESLKASINDVHDDVNRRTLSQADIVGITTTALARNANIIRHVRPKVVICEEAAEVMEPHVISALMPGVEHLIQIGDHRQLRPQINTYELSMESKSGLVWQLDRSQFERRAVGEPGLKPAPVAQLNVQRRMRPEISRLIRTVYPNLQDHDSVKDLPDVVGMRQNLFWLDHEHVEDQKADDSRTGSRSNQWEVEMAKGLVRHLVRQGKYSPTDIALLTPYSGQLQSLRRELSSQFEIYLSDRDLQTLDADGFGDDQNMAKEKDRPQAPKQLQRKQLAQTLRLATVDNFQGEEAKVIIVSLVRSNAERRVGFLRTENRINVLLSRAQHGMFLIGNAATYLNVGMWSDVHGQLAGADAVGRALPLCCPRHPDTEILCAEPVDFERKSPEGGCTLTCDRRLEPCGHRCQAKCHSDMMHESFACPQPCPRIRATCDHGCPKTCGDECGSCMVAIHDTVLPCGHVKDTLCCYQKQNLSSIKCTVKMQKTIPGCGHSPMVDCNLSVEAKSFRCPVPCEELLGCGHICPGTCESCRRPQEDGTAVFEHGKCRRICDRPHGTCNHRCPLPCHAGKECGSCMKKCEVRCPHSACGSACSQACTPCIERCTWVCDHQGACTMPCAAPCDRLPCDERCTRTLRCGHQCPSFCGEDCPEGYCQECGDRLDDRVDMLEFKTYSEIDVGESPIVVLGCGHFFTGETLDGMVGMADVYSLDGNGEYNGLQDLSTVPMANGIPSCPDCKRPIRQFATRRYNRVINRAVMDETSKRFIATGRNDLRRLEARLKTIEDNLDSTRQAARGSGGAQGAEGNASLRQRYVEALKLAKDAQSLKEQMETTHQPTKKLLDAIVTSRRSVATADQDPLVARMGQLRIAAALPAFDKRITLAAWLVRIKVRETMLRDIFDLIEKLDMKGILGVSTAPYLATLAVVLRESVQVTMRLYEGPRYEVVTPEELAAIKTAMVSGAGGIATHSGHWYNCANGHPFAIGECGMPMELARCPECGASIGGYSHALTQGNTRAENMER